MPNSFYPFFPWNLNSTTVCVCVCVSLSLSLSEGQKLNICMNVVLVFLPFMQWFQLAGPKLAFCAGPLIDSLLRLQAEHHVKFTAVESSYIWR